MRPAEAPKLTVRVTPLVRLTRGDARGLVTVPRHHDNRVLRVILESEDYYSRSDIQLDGEEAAQNHHLYWRNLPPGSYWVTVEVYGLTRAPRFRTCRNAREGDLFGRQRTRRRSATVKHIP